MKTKSVFLLMFVVVSYFKKKSNLPNSSPVLNLILTSLNPKPTAYSMEIFVVEMNQLK